MAIFTQEQQDLITLERILTEISNNNLCPNMFSRCLDCQTWGNTFPYDRQCGNCNSLNLTRYYNESTISKYMLGRTGSESICLPFIDSGESIEIRDGKIMANKNVASLIPNLAKRFSCNIK